VETVAAAVAVVVDAATDIKLSQENLNESHLRSRGAFILSNRTAKSAVTAGVRAELAIQSFGSESAA
jgi:hypothetical protein